MVLPVAYILLAEDDLSLLRGLARTLELSGHTVDKAKNGVEAEAALCANCYDLMILDIGLPHKDGLAVLDDLRKGGKVLPVLILTALDTPQDRILGLDLGANDYMCKPFNVGELEARIRALLRKEKWGNRTGIRCGALLFNTFTNKFFIAEEPIDLSPREFLVLELLLQRKGRVVFKNDLMYHLASLEKDMTSNALDIVIHRLRKKIDHSGCKIQTVKGLGFIIE